MAERRRGLGRGIGALIPDNQRESKDRPFDVFFGGGSTSATSVEDLQERTANPAGEGSIASESLKEAQAATGDSQQSFLELLGIANPAEGGADTPKPARSSEPKSTRRAKSDAVDAPRNSDVAEGGVKVTAPTVDVEEPSTPVATEGKGGGGDAESSIAEPESTDDTTADAVVTVTVAVEEDTIHQGEGTSQVDDGDLIEVPGATYAELPTNSIVPNQRQPRSVFDEDDLEELANSIREVGVLQPVIVRPLTAPIPELPEARYELIMGERRLRASQLVGADTIPALVRHTADEDLLRDALLENLHRAQLNPLEEAAAYQQLLEDFNCTQEELARRVARSRPQITNTLRLLKLPPLVQRRVAAQVLTAGHARALLGLSDAATMERIAQRIVAENLSVRQVEELVAMGEEPQSAPVIRRRARRYAPELGSLSGRLTDRFDTRVKVDMGIRKGTIKIDFATIEDLNRILGVMSPEIDGVDASEGPEA